MEVNNSVLEFKFPENLEIDNIKYYVISYLDKNNNLHFETNCVNKVFLLGMIEILKDISKKVVA